MNKEELKHCLEIREFVKCQSGWNIILMTPHLELETDHQKLTLTAIKNKIEKLMYTMQLLTMSRRNLIRS